MVLLTWQPSNLLFSLGIPDHVTLGWSGSSEPAWTFQVDERMNPEGYPEVVIIFKGLDHLGCIRDFVLKFVKNKTVVYFDQRLGATQFVQSIDWIKTALEHEWNNFVIECELYFK